MKTFISLFSLLGLLIGCTGSTLSPPQRSEKSDRQASETENTVDNSNSTGDTNLENLGSITAFVGTWSLCQKNEPFSASEKITHEIDAQGKLTSSIRWYRDAECTTEYPEIEMPVAMEQIVAMDGSTGTEADQNRAAISALYAGTQITRTIEVGKVLEDGLVEVNVKTDPITEVNFSGGMEYLVFKMTNGSIEMSALCDQIDVNEAVAGSYCADGAVGDTPNTRSQKLDGIVFTRQ